MGGWSIMSVRFGEQEKQDKPRYQIDSRGFDASDLFSLPAPSLETIPGPQSFLPAGSHSVFLDRLGAAIVGTHLFQGHPWTC